MFVYRLALHFGIWDIDSWLCQITWEQLQEWYAYYLIEPFGEERADLRVAINTATLAEINRDRKRRPKPYSAADFMPKFGAAASRQPLTDPAKWAQWKNSLKVGRKPTKGSAK